MTKAAIYVRRSSEDFKSGESIDGQIELCRGVVFREGYQLVGTYVDDHERGSTSARDRDGLSACFEAAVLKKFDVLIIEDISRLSRRQLAMLTYLEELEDLNISIHQAHRGSLDYNDVLSIGVEAATAERYSRDATLKGTNARYRRVLMGFVMSSGAKFGYNLVRTEGGTKYELDPPTAAEVERIFREFNSGTSYSDIARSVKIPKRTGTAWDDKGVKRILEDTTYIGQWLYGVQKVKTRRNQKTRFYVPTDDYIEAQPGIVPDHETLERAKKSVVLVRVPRIVSDKVFYTAQDRIESVRRAHTQTPTSHVFILQGRVTCLECGGKFWARTRENVKLLAYRHRDGAVKYLNCPNKPISFYRDQLEHPVLDELVKLLQTPLEEIVEQHKERVKGSELELEDLQIEKVRLKTMLKAGMMKNLEGVFSDDDWYVLEADINAKIAALDDKAKYLREVTEPSYLDWMPTEKEGAEHEKDMFEVEGRDYFSPEEWFELITQLNVQVEVVKQDSGGSEIRLLSDLGNVHWPLPRSRPPLSFRGGEQLPLHRMF